jgi:Ca2+-binding EF-hand superfamily protein/thiol-disulfide isomerase/thioredoxin
MVTMNKLKLFSFISFLCICTATADAVAVTNSVDAASLSVPAADAESSVVSSDTNSDAAGSLSEENKNAASDNVDAAESAEANQKEEEEHHELTEAFEIMDEDEDGVLSKEELVNAAYITGVNGDISLEEYAEKLMTKQVADADGSVEMKIDMDTFTAMLSLASTEVAAEEGQAPSMNQQWSQLASEVIISYYHPQDDHSESAEANQEEEHHELTEAFEIMDEDEDGVLSKEELVKAAWITGVNGEISPEEYAEKLITKQVADADGSVEMKIDMDTFTAMLSLASTEIAAEEGQAPSMNQQWSQLASEVIISYYHPQEEPEWYNPHNMTYEELEYHLYEWEEDAVGHVNEYLDWEVFERMRNEADDYYKNEGAEEQVKEEDEKKNPKHHDNGKKTVVEMRKSNTNHYLKLSPDVAHVVEFYQPWCPHCQHYKSDYIEVAKETKRRATTTQGVFTISKTCYIVFPFLLIY